MQGPYDLVSVGAVMSGDIGRKSKPHLHWPNRILLSVEKLQGGNQSFVLQDTSMDHSLSDFHWYGRLDDGPPK